MSGYGSIKLSNDTAYHHITHWKAGSQWFLAVLKAAFKSAVVQPEEDLRHVTSRPAEGGRIYPCCYMTQSEYRALHLPAKARRIVLIRDLRDTLISGYFSIRDSHKSNAFVDKWRPVLSRSSMEDGLMYLMDEWLVQSAHIQRGWLANGETVTRLEDFMTKPVDTLREVLKARWDVKISKWHAARLMRRQSFERHSGGRKPGQEDRSSHYRKGVHGDWRKYLTPKAVQHFKERFNKILLQSGYESSPDWFASE